MYLRVDFGASERITHRWRKTNKKKHVCLFWLHSSWLCHCCWCCEPHSLVVVVFFIYKSHSNDRIRINKKSKKSSRTEEQKKIIAFTRQTDRQNHNKSRQTHDESNIIINIYIYFLKWTSFRCTAPCALFFSFIHIDHSRQNTICRTKDDYLFAFSSHTLYLQFETVFFSSLYSLCFAYSLFALYFYSYFNFIVILCLLEMINELVILTCDKRSSFQNAYNAHSILCLW